MKAHLIFLLVVACLVFGACTDHSKEISEANKTTAEQIISALENYSQDNGRFPSQLSDLVPRYLFVLPETTEGVEFFYKADKVVEYYLCFEISSGKIPGCCYVPQHELWDCTRGVE